MSDQLLSNVGGRQRWRMSRERVETCATGCTKCTYKTKEEALPLFQGRTRHAKDREDKRKPGKEQGPQSTTGWP